MSEPLFDALFDQSAVGIAAFSIGGRFLRANPAFCRLLGYTEQELLQKTHLDVIHVDDLEAAAVSRAQVISGKMEINLKICNALSRAYMRISPIQKMVVKNEMGLKISRLFFSSRYLISHHNGLLIILFFEQ